MANTSYTVQFYIELPNGELQKSGDGSVMAGSVDDARHKTRELVVQRNLPPVRTLSFGADGQIHVVCGIHPQAAEPPEGMRHRWRRPPGPTRP